MKRPVALAVAALCGALLAPSLRPQASAEDAFVQRARGFIAALEKGDFQGAVADFDAAMTKALGTEKMAALWQQLTPLATFGWALAIGERLTGVTLFGVLLGIAGVVYGAVLGHVSRPDASPVLREAAAGLPTEEP